MQFYSGTGIPALTLGDSGDVYLDTDAVAVYFKTDHSTWTVASVTSGDISDTAYDATSWNAVTDVAPSKNAVRDKIEALNTAKRDTAFTPTTSGDWSPAPTTIQGAIDQLASRVKALEP